MAGTIKSCIVNSTECFVICLPRLVHSFRLAVQSCKNKQSARAWRLEFRVFNNSGLGVWDVGRTSASCVPRLCPLSNDVHGQKAADVVRLPCSWVRRTLTERAFTRGRDHAQGSRSFQSFAFDSRRTLGRKSKNSPLGGNLAAREAQ